MKPSIVFFIPAIGNCHQIPRKFLRTLNGKPLIGYSVELAKNIASPKHVVVLNDDEEIDLIARRLSVRAVFIKNKEAFPRQFGESISLMHLFELESGIKKKFEYVVWLGPSSPLLRERDIIEAVSALEESSHDAVFSASEVPAHSWVYTDTYQPSFREVQNSSRTGFMHMETGAFFIMKRSAIGQAGYRGKSAGPFYLHESHALEINTFNDWWVAEKLLRRKQILFVVAGYPEIGMGHISRSLMLAQEFNDHEIQFLCTKESDLAVKHISENLYPTFQQEDNESLEQAVLKLSPDLVINDILNTSEGYVNALKEQRVQVINFEDEGSGVRAADLVINALYDHPSRPNMVSGHQYFCLRTEFFSAPASRFREKVENILITFGGTDENNLSLRVLQLLVEIAVERTIKLCLVTGPGYSHKESMNNYVRSLSEMEKQYVRWIANGTKQISEYMSEADFGITSAGRTVYEFAALRIPVIIIAANRRETTHTFGVKTGMPFLGLHSNVTDRMVEEGVLSFIDDFERRRKIREKLKNFDLTKGKENVIGKIREILKEK